MLKSLIVALAICTAPTTAAPLDIPQQRLAPRPHAPRVALTFDACSGRVDARILNALVAMNIKSTIFVTARWLKRNPQAIATMKAHSHLFQIENHGARHVVAIDFPMTVFGVKSAGSPHALEAEIEGGAAAIRTSFGHSPRWFRGATAIYSKTSKQRITSQGYHIAGFSRLGDDGTKFSARRVAKTFAEAIDGDIIIAHINQPLKPAGTGVVEGIAALQSKGFVFVTLNEGLAPLLRPVGH